MSDADVIIIGGGIAGLSAALHLAERGLHPLILEADEKFIGGRLAGGETVRIGEHSFRLEHGVHGIWSQYRNLQAVLARHKLRPVFVPAQEENWVYRAGKFVGTAPVGSAILQGYGIKDPGDHETGRPGVFEGLPQDGPRAGGRED